MIKIQIKKNGSFLNNTRNLIFTGECNCNLEGSINDNACDQTTGVCACKPGWSGDKCKGKLHKIS